MEWAIYALMAAIAAAVSSIINKKILSHEHAIEFTASRGLILLMLCLFLIPFVNFELSWEIYLAVYFVSVLISAGMISFMKSIRHSEVSSIVPLMNISPLFLLAISYLVLGETVSTRQCVGVFILLLGTYVLEIGVTNKGFIEPIKEFLKSKAIRYIVFSMIIFSITATFDKLIVSNYTPFMTYLFLTMIFQSINYVLLDTIKFGFPDVVRNVQKDFKLLFFDSVLLMIGNVFYFFCSITPKCTNIADNTNQKNIRPFYNNIWRKDISRKKPARQGSWLHNNALGGRIHNTINLKD